MNFFEQPSWTRPESTASTGAVARGELPGARPGDAASLLLSQGKVGRSDSRRIALGLIALGIICVALLNVVLYQNERGDLVQRRWEQLERGTETKRNEVRALIGQLQRQIAYAAAHPALAGATARAMAGTLDAAQRRDLQRELDRTVQALHLHSLVLVSPSGVRLASSSGAPGAPSAGQLAIARRALESGERIASGIRTASNGYHVIEVAAVVDRKSVV